jgi:hypothetical protein
MSADWGGLEFIFMNKDRNKVKGKKEPVFSD